MKLVVDKEKGWKSHLWRLEMEVGGLEFISAGL